MLKLLILTQYFPPEVGAPQNRLFELAVRLYKSGVDITVLTAMPNYPQMEIYERYKDKKYVYEEVEGLKVHRSSIYVSKSKSIFKRLRNYFSFVYSSARIGNSKLDNFDFLLCESPPLFLGYSAMFLAKRKRAKLIFNVSDLWPESAEKLGVVNNKCLLKLAYNLEKRLYERSVLVTGQTQGICSNIQQRFPAVKTYWLPNGVDLNYYDPDQVINSNWRQKNNFSEADFIFLYAGIIGIAQGLEVILKAAKEFKAHTSVKFVLMGSGPEKTKLLALKEKLQLINVTFLEPVTKKEMPSVLKGINAAIVPLRKLDLFLGAIPSKLFENLSMKIPVLLGVDGEARDLFVKQGNCGLYFEPENVSELVKTISTLVSDRELSKCLGENGRSFVNQHFNREIIAEKFYRQLINL
ncbi:glycosyltransferase family 4 protein [Aurantibacillus circumpalustris]|uniref:glycosyltransferase family 4 protein n=1 Tax=Aurantibacillus circumpalustris TaxID=3036359 RepID=UPI00295BE476|nr:glycosyltransferase family 4 protein [Aurantibacillus circumpalustris]